MTAAKGKTVWEKNALVGLMVLVLLFEYNLRHKLNFDTVWCRVNFILSYLYYCLNKSVLKTTKHVIDSQLSHLNSKMEMPDNRNQ